HRAAQMLYPKPCLPCPLKSRETAKEKTLTAPSEDIVVDPSLIPPAFLGAVGDASRDQSVQFHSFD
ncbi:hypothetical protein M9458_001814, partial [Cirrhinus mrigala]